MSQAKDKEEAERLEAIVAELKANNQKLREEIQALKDKIKQAERYSFA
jgi:chaperonin cofactor prefoldin